MRLHILRVFGVAASLAWLAPLPAFAEEQMTWAVESYPNDLPGSTDTVILTYGIPQTDAVAFEALCGGPDGTTPRVVFWYDILDLAEGQDVVLSLGVGPSRQEVPAQVYGKDVEVGVTGLQASIAIDAPIWDILRSNAALSYGVVGGKQETLNLKGAAASVEAFAAACRANASPAEDWFRKPEHRSRTAPARDSMAEAAGSSVAASILNKASKQSPPSAALDGDLLTARVEAVACEQFGKIKSVRSEAPAKITFINKSDGYRGIVWIDTEGTPIDNTGLNQGERVVVPTFQAHAWMITDGPGNCIEMVVAGDGDTTFDITAPAPASGPKND